MVVCCAVGCSHRSDRKKSQVSFHVFPKNVERRSEWIKAVQRLNWEPTDNTRICSEHFNKDDYEKDSKRLKGDAVPSIFSGFSASLKVSKCRKLSSNFAPAVNLAIPGCSNSTQADISPVEAIEVKEVKEDDREKTFEVEINETDSTVDEEAFSTDAAVDKEAFSTDTAVDKNSSSTDTAIDEEIFSTDSATEDKEINTEFTTFNEESHSKTYYIWKLKHLTVRYNNQSKKIRILRQQIRRKDKKITKLSSIINQIREGKLNREDDFDVIAQSSKPSFSELLSRQLAKAKGSAIQKEYSSELKSFALNLHFCSPQAYSYVRETLLTSLPHPRTLAKWYRKID